MNIMPYALIAIVGSFLSGFYGVYLWYRLGGRTLDFYLKHKGAMFIDLVLILLGLGLVIVTALALIMILFWAAWSM